MYKMLTATFTTNTKSATPTSHAKRPSIIGSSSSTPNVSAEPPIVANAVTSIAALRVELGLDRHGDLQTRTAASIPRCPSSHRNHHFSQLVRRRRPVRLGEIHLERGSLANRAPLPRNEFTREPGVGSGETVERPAVQRGGVHPARQLSYRDVVRGPGGVGQLDATVEAKLVGWRHARSVVGHAKKQQPVACLGARTSGCRPRSEPRERRGDVFVSADVANEPHPQRRKALDAAREVVPSRRCRRRTRPLAAKLRRRRRESRGKRPRERCAARVPGLDADGADRAIGRQEFVRGPLEAQAPGVLSRVLADDGPEDAMKVERRQAGVPGQRVE